jgi:steroid delta-isomerase-like uncharacterized protein
MGTGNERDQFAEFLTKPDYDSFVALFSPDAVYIEPVGGRHEGHSAIRQWLDSTQDMLSDLHFETTRVLQHDSVIVAEYLSEATNTGPVTMPDGTVIPATGKTLNFPVVTILDLRDGQIVALRAYYDQLDVLSQLGLMPRS